MFQTADWKKEKHAPVIELPEDPKKGEVIKIQVSIGKEIAHPNTTEHHINYIALIFHPDGEKFPHIIGRAEFVAHGESPEGPNKSTIYTEPHAIFALKTEKSGKLIATSYCNIHGLWKSELDLKI